MGSSSTVAIAQQLAKALFFGGVPDDILVNILCRLDEDPRDLARLACVSRRFCMVIKTVCWKFRCEKSLPLLVAELLQVPSPALHPEPPGGWSALQKLLVCCPGLWHAGVLLESWDFGLDRELGSFDNSGCLDSIFPAGAVPQFFKGPDFCDGARKKACDKQPLFPTLECSLSAGITCSDVDGATDVSGKVCEMAQNSTATHRYANEEGKNCNGHEAGLESNLTQHTHCPALKDVANEVVSFDPSNLGQADQVKQKQEHRNKSAKRQRQCHHENCHVATGPWNLSREQGNKLLANRFRADSLYICDWPGCIHPGDKRIYKLFRGVFKNFKSSHVWRNLRDMQAKTTNVGCAFCMCKSTWDMVTTFCLKRSIEFHDDGEPVVRAFVCENGHVAGAWTDRPMYTP